VLRVNAAGILGKTGSPELADMLPSGLARDRSMRLRYLTAVRIRVGDRPDQLARELTNPRDCGARWCAAHLLANSGHTEPYPVGSWSAPAMVEASHGEEVTWAAVK
jgi:hypothetical protein